MSTSGAKPFSLQSPEAIAKQYEGNKQKIAQAVQLGLVDATAGTLAGMFIDRMRSAAMQEQGPPQTVAQQVLGSSPPAPPPGGPPMAPQAGGSPPPPMPAPQGAPPASSAAPMGGPPVRAADGGLMSIPIPDTMFDEPEGASMARGGLVAFAGAGPVAKDEEGRYSNNPYPYGRNGPLDEWLAGEFDEEPKEREPDPKGYVPFSKSKMGQFLPNLGAGIAERTKSTPEQEAKAMRNNREINNLFTSMWGGTRKEVSPEELAAQKTARAPKPTPKAAANAPAGIPDMRVAGTPKPKEGERFIGRDGRVYTQQTSEAPEAPSKGGLGGTREALANPILAAAKMAGPKHAEQIKDAADQAAGKPTIEGQSKDPIADAIAKYAGYLEDPEYKAYMEGEKSKLSKQKKEDVWTTLAQIGFGMAASKSPTLLGAVGEAGTAAMPNIQKALQARRAAEADYAKQRMDTRRAAVTGGIGVAQNAEQVGLKREEMAQKERQFEAELDSAWKRAQLQAGAQIRGAQISAAAQAERETDFKFAVRSMANNLYNNNRQKYPTYETALAAAIKEYVGDVHPGSGDGPNIAEALAGAGGGNRNGYNPNAVREKQ